MNHLLSFPYLWTFMSKHATGVTVMTVLGAGISQVAFCDVHVGFVSPALIAASTLNKFVII